jgi:CRP-like cAMP-binding protein
MNTPSSPLPEIPPVGFLAEVPADHRAFLTGVGRFDRPAKGLPFIHEGHPQEAISLVVEGTLHVMTALNEQPLLLAELGPGDVIGEVNLFDPTAASATVIARSDCLIWSMTRDELSGLIESDLEAGNSVMWGLLRLLSHRVRIMNEKLVEYRDLSAKLGYEKHPYEND